MFRRLVLTLGLSLILTTGGAETAAPPPPPDGVLTAAPQPHPDFTCRFIDENPEKPAWIVARDLDGDRRPELIVSVFAGSSPVGSGFVAIYRQAGDGYGTWEKSILPGSKGTRFANDITVTDVDGDGDLDLIVPSGFLATTPFSSGMICWYENQGGNTWQKREVIVGQKLFYHFVEHVDIDGDGCKDMVTVAEQKGATQVQFFKGKGKGAFAASPTVIAKNVAGSLPTVLDLDRDGDLDIISAQFFVDGADAVWLENTGGEWVTHVIDDRVGPSIQLSIVPNLIGDGRDMAILANHVNSSDKPSGPKEGVFLLPVPETREDLVKPWPAKLISAGMKCRPSPMAMPQGAPGVFRTGDVDGDKDIDIVVHGDGDARVYLLEQVAPGQFETRVLLTEMAQGGVAVDDLDGDGVCEIVASSYEMNRLAVLKHR